jgi:hypothetical protein
MRARIVMILAILTTLFLGGQTPALLQREYDALTRRGYTFRMLDSDLIELTEPVSGAKQLKSLREPSEMEIRKWAAQRGIPTLEIDPNTVDTSQYTGWFRYWSSVPLSNTEFEPLLVGDVDRNGKGEVYGLWLDYGVGPASWVVQVDTNGGVSFLYDFAPRVGLAQRLIDSDKDSLLEFTMTNVGHVLDFEQYSTTGLPTILRFDHQRYRSYLDPGGTHLYFGNLDNDSLLDFLYNGSELDSIDTTLAHAKVYVAEYDTQAVDFIRKWSTDYGLSNAGIAGFAVDDFDCDQRMEFAVSEFWGRTFVTENVGNDSFVVTWHDTTPFVNTNYIGSGDVDNDGRPEFFIGATLSDGDWTTVFEADSDNHFSPKLLIHLLSGGTFDNPQYMAADVDGDGKLELVICAGADIYMFKSNMDNQYFLWYLKRENARDAIQFYDFNQDGRRDFVVSKRVFVNPPGYFRYYADIYIGTSLVSVNDHMNEAPNRIMLLPNYPNPFNPSTVIQFSLPSRSHVVIVVYDMLGKEVEKLFEESMDAGMHSVAWRAEGRSAGMYICRLIAGNQAVSRKLLLIH